MTIISFISLYYLIVLRNLLAGNYSYDIYYVVTNIVIYLLTWYISFVLNSLNRY